MTVNPREYDADELRELAGAEPVEEGSDGRAPKPDESVRDEQFRQLLALQSERQQLDQLSRPFLTALPESELGSGVREEWLDFLVHVGGHDRTKQALGYYRGLQWITPAVEADLRSSVDRFPEPTHDRSLTAGDHRLSLLYIATLASVP
jgi:flagellar protein FlaD